MFNTQNSFPYNLTVVLREIWHFNLRKSRFRTFSECKHNTIQFSLLCRRWNMLRISRERSVQNSMDRTGNVCDWMHEIICRKKHSVNDDKDGVGWVTHSQNKIAHIHQNPRVLRAKITCRFSNNATFFNRCTPSFRLRRRYAVGFSWNGRPRTNLDWGSADITRLSWRTAWSTFPRKTRTKYPDIFWIRRSTNPT